MNPTHLFLGTKSDNSADMVRKGRQNSVRGEGQGSSKLTEANVRAIREEYATGQITQKELGRKYGVTHSNISVIVLRDTWEHVK